MEAINAGQVSQHALRKLNEELSVAMKGDVVFVNSPIYPPLDNEFRVVIERIRDESKQNHLVVLLETTGGQMETVERLVSVMRNHYKMVSFVVPDFAYSAGTVLALSGDEIYMDYYSVLGPIDPQYRSNDGTYHSGHGTLAKCEELISKVNGATSGGNVNAELAILLKNFDPAHIFDIEQAVQHGITLIAEWLPKYKFKNWATTKTRKEKVTPKLRRQRAEEIARTLGDAAKWHSHGRGIPMHRLKSDELKLRIEDFGAEPELNSLIKNYHGLAIDHFSKAGMRGFVHSKFSARGIA